MKSEKKPASNVSTSRNKVVPATNKKAKKVEVVEAQEPEKKTSRFFKKKEKPTQAAAPQEPIYNYNQYDEEYSNPTGQYYYEEPKSKKLNKRDKTSIVVCVILILLIGTLIINGILTIYDPKYFYGPLRYITPITYAKNYHPEGAELELISRLPAYYTLTLIPVLISLFAQICYIKRDKYTWLNDHLQMPLFIEIATAIVFITYTMQYHNNYSSIVHNFFEPGYDAFLDDVRYGITNFLTGFAGHGYWFIAPFFVNISLTWKCYCNNTGDGEPNSAIRSLVWFVLVMIVLPLVLGKVVAAKNTGAVVGQFLVLIILGAGSFIGTGGGRYYTLHGHVEDNGDVTFH